VNVLSVLAVVGFVACVSLGAFVLHLGLRSRRNQAREEIAGRERGEQELRESQESYRMLTELLPEAVAVHVAGRLMYINTAGVELFGMKDRSEWLGMDIMERVHPAYRRLVAERVRMSYEERKAAGRLEEVFLRMDGTPFDVATSTAPVTYMGKPATILVISDISERKRAEQALRESEERYRALYADIPSMYFTVDPVGIVLSVNTFGASQLGYTVDDLVGGSVLKMFPPDQQAEATARVAECLAHPGELFVWELRKIRKDGSLIDVRETARAVSDHEGRPIVLIVCEDITERRMLQQQLVQAEKMEAIGHLAGGIAHDFNNLLTAIRGFAELHLAEHAPGDPGRADVLEIEHAAERAAQLTRGLLAFSRRAEVHPTPLDLAAVVRDEVPLLRRLVGEHIVVRLDASVDVPLALADRAQIEEVLLNLAANARDAMPAGGTLGIAVKTVTLSAAYVKAHPGARTGRHVLLAVSDTGAGMDEATQAHLFEPFFTTKPPGKGTGLGLASVYGIVKQAGGYIDVMSHRGGGSVFRVYLPALQGATRETSIEPMADQPPGVGTETILLVEDDPAVRLFAERVLQECGYRVLSFADPGVALDAAMHDARAFDALVTDVVMPTMSGPTLAERIASVRPGLPVVFMSGYEAGALPAGAPRPLAKPFGARELTDAVGALFGRRP
jgi:PAS domain S-box-containing protein